MHRLIIGISGATGAIYGIRLLEALKGTNDVETHLVITDMARATISLETDYNVKEVEDLADQVYNIRDLTAPIASGSIRTEGMIVAPCSVKTLSSLANSTNDNLLTRAADVCMKERRRLVILFRETPLHEGHCELMMRVSRMGALVMPPVPAFYSRPKIIDDIINHTVGRVLDLWGLDLIHFDRWDRAAKKPRSSKGDGRKPRN